MKATFQRFYGQLLAAVGDENAHSLALKLSLFTILFYATDQNSVNTLLSILVCIGLLFDKLRQKPLLWGGLFAILLARAMFLWFDVDNHQYLIGYWCLAVLISCLPMSDSKQVMAVSGRLLIGLAFFFATFSKGISPDYRDGRFFHNTLLTDHRIQVPLTRYVGGLEAQDLRDNRQVVMAIEGSARPEASYSLKTTDQTRLLALVVTWWTILIEAAVALCFLAFFSPWLSRIRDYLLLVFVFTTYPIAPILGFGSILVTMGFAQATSSHLRLLYLITFLLLFLFTLPLAKIFDQLLF